MSSHHTIPNVYYDAANTSSSYDAHLQSICICFQRHHIVSHQLRRASAINIHLVPETPHCIPPAMTCICNQSAYGSSDTTLFPLRSNNTISFSKPRDPIRWFAGGLPGGVVGDFRTLLLLLAAVLQRSFLIA